MATEVKVRGASIEVRSLSVTKALLKQVRVFKGTPPEPFCKPDGPENLLTTKPEVLPEFCVGWFRGTVLGEDDSDYILFSKDGDLYLGKMYREVFRWKLPKECKQLYIA